MRTQGSLCDFLDGCQQSKRDKIKYPHYRPRWSQFLLRIHQIPVNHYQPQLNGNWGSLARSQSFLVCTWIFDHYCIPGPASVIIRKKNLKPRHRNMSKPSRLVETLRGACGFDRRWFYAIDSTLYYNEAFNTRKRKVYRMRKKKREIVQ